MIEYASKKEKSSTSLALVLLVCGLIFFLLSEKFGVSPFIVQLIAIALIVFAVQVIQRYVLSSFIYIIDDSDNGSSLFTVVKVQGKNRTTVCSVELEKCLYAGDSDKKGVKTTNTFDYRQNILSKDKFVLVYDSGRENVLIRLEADDTFKSAVMCRVNNA